MDPEMRQGEPTIPGTRIPVDILLARVTHAFEKVGRESPGIPWDLGEVSREAAIDFATDYTHISIHQAEQAIGFMFLALAERALECKAAVFEKAISRQLDREAATNRQGKVA